MSTDFFANRPFFLKALSLVQERTKKLSEVKNFLQFFYEKDDALAIDANLYTHAKMGTSAETAPIALQFSLEVIETIGADQWTLEGIKEAFITSIKKAGYKNGFVLYPLRVALSGEEFSPGTFELLEIFGKQKSIVRVQSAMKQLKK